MLKENEFYIGDNKDLIKEIDDESVDLYLFSPPYGSIRDYDSKNYSFDYEFLGKEIFRTLKEGGVCVVNYLDQIENHSRNIIMYKMVVHWVENVGFKLFENIIWHKHGKPGAWWNKRFRVDNEFILIFHKGKKPKYFNKEHLSIPAKYANKSVKFNFRKTSGDFKKSENVMKNLKCRGTVWFYNASNNESKIKEKFQHPATYPEKLCDDIIFLFTEKNDLVVDIFCGSGTTCFSAYKNKRKFIGIDISEKYINLSKSIYEKYYKEVDEHFIIDHDKI